VLKSPTSRWIAGTAALCLALLVLAYLTLVGPRRDEAASLTDQTVAEEQQNDQVQLRTAQLRALYATLPQRRADLAAMLEQMPVTADVPGLVRSLDAVATSSGVSLDAVTPSSATYLDATAGAAGAAPAGGAGSVRPVVVALNLTVHGPYFKDVTFLKKLQTGKRAYLVSGLQVSVADGVVTMTVKGSVYALPGAAQALQAMSGGASTAGATTPAGATTAGGAAQADGTGSSPMGSAAPTGTAAPTAPSGAPTSPAAQPTSPAASAPAAPASTR
jgi:hypothetical protein